MMRQEYPRPSFIRKDWQNLNGEWDFEILTSADSDESRLCKKPKTKINVPFCPESRLSGVAHTDFIEKVQYRREISVTAEQLCGRVLLHIGAADHDAAVYINKKPAATHSGGYVGFSTDITERLSAGNNTVDIFITDDTRNNAFRAASSAMQKRAMAAFTQEPPAYGKLSGLNSAPLPVYPIKSE